MRRIRRPKDLVVIGGRNSPLNIISSLPMQSCFFDFRHWTYEFTDGVLPFALTSRVSANNQQFLFEVYGREGK